MSPRRRAVLLAFLATSLGLGAIVLSFPNLYDADIRARGRIVHARWKVSWTGGASREKDAACSRGC